MYIPARGSQNQPSTADDRPPQCHVTKFYDKLLLSPGAAPIRPNLPGIGIGASHQTGWTGCIARIIQIMGDVTPETLTGADFEMAAIKKTVGK
jgi:hypothetical protein